MQVSDEQPQSCWSCQKRPATTTYTDKRGRWSFAVCDTCLDQLEVHEAFQHLDTYSLMKERKYDAALALTESFFEANRHRDHDGWLARSVAAHRASILHEAGRYAEALEAYDAAERLGFENVTYRWAHGLAKARTLQALGRHEDALAAFEESFSHEDPTYAYCAAYFLSTLAELYENLGRPVDEKWRAVALKAAEEYGIKMPVRKTLAKSMRVLEKHARRMRPKHEKEWRKNHEGEGDGSS